VPSTFLNNEGFMKTILALSLSMISTFAHAGPSISGGIIHNERFEACANKKEKVTFTVGSLMSPSNVLGTLTEDKESTILKCKSGINMTGSLSKEEIVWTCNENRPGEGQLLVTVYRSNQGLKYAQVSRKDILQRYVVMYNMNCDQQVSN
jgi:hypothetical protein